MLLNRFIAPLGGIFILLGILLYFKNIPFVYQVGSMVGLGVAQLLLLFISGTSAALLFSWLVYIILSTIFFIQGILNRVFLRRQIGNSMKWFYGTFLFFILTLFFLLYLFFEQIPYGLYESENDLFIILNYTLALGFTFLLIILFIHTEYSLSDLAKSSLADHYSHHLGNLLQKVIIAAYVLEHQELPAYQVQETLEMIQQTCQEGAVLLSEIREF